MVLWFTSLAANILNNLNGNTQYSHSGRWQQLKKLRRGVIPQVERIQAFFPFEQSTNDDILLKYCGHFILIQITLQCLTHLGLPCVFEQNSEKHYQQQSKECCIHHCYMGTICLDVAVLFIHTTPTLHLPS